MDFTLIITSVVGAYITGFLFGFAFLAWRRVTEKF